MGGGPVTSGYPGTPYLLIVAGICVFLIIFFVIRIRKARRQLKAPKYYSDDIARARAATAGLILALISIFWHYLGFK
jgi:hypothetical protein